MKNNIEIFPWGTTFYQFVGWKILTDSSNDIDVDDANYWKLATFAIKMGYQIVLGAANTEKFVCRDESSKRLNVYLERSSDDEYFVISKVYLG